MTKLELYDKEVEIYALETCAICNMYYIESSSSIVDNIIERIKKLIKKIKRKIEKMITLNSFASKKRQILDAIKKHKLLRFKKVSSYDVSKVIVLTEQTFKQIRESNKPSEDFEKCEDKIDTIIENNKDFLLGDIIKKIDITRCAKLLNDIDDETDSLESRYNKLMKDEEENADDINIIIERLRCLSRLVLILNTEITRELQLLNMSINYD